MRLQLQGGRLQTAGTTGPQLLLGSGQGRSAEALETGQMHGVRYRDGSRAGREHQTTGPGKPHRCGVCPRSAFSEDAVELSFLPQVKWV